MDKFLKNVLAPTLIVFLLISGLMIIYKAPAVKIEDISLSTLVSQINNNEVKDISVSGSELKIELNNGTQEKASKEAESSLTETLANYGVNKESLQKVNIEIKRESGVALWAGIILPFLLPILLIVGFLWFMMRQAQRGNSQAMSFGMSKARMIDPKDKKKRTLFKDVAGAKEAKEELMEVVEFLKHPKKFLNMGAKIPKGVLLLGPPGTGKTLVAKAVAGEAGVPFFNISGSEFVEMFVGVGASRVRDLFKQAKKNAPAIVFIDEIDAVGRHRGAGLGGGHDEREQTLNQILVEMDGFETGANVIVMAATNRPDVLDPALLRPGRFDRRVTLDLPDINERKAILKIHCKNKKLEEDVNIENIAQRTPGFSGADLANLVNEGAILSARKNKTKIGMEELRESIEKVMMGPERRSRVIRKDEQRIVAYHEAGHALVAAFSKYADPVQKISIISRGSAGGYTMAVPTEDKMLHSRGYFLDEIAVLLSGYVTEQETFGDVTTGASNDLERATNMARNMVTRYGMSDLGPRTFGKKEELIFLGKEVSEQKNYSEKTAQDIDIEVHNLIEGARKRSLELITLKKDKLDKLAETLIEKETIEKEEFDEIVGITGLAEKIEMVENKETKRIEE
ncbi:MAG: ATP-dependent zinc metalloprotease FtsH [Candidatus Moranbacteria bacterium GW2011_GWF2_34_56]|nr:MAG: ATP-dependent zinc metalloprotease FtsH [Candidatus Moranbacteria bacterium GW2011_GWF1_34_10]KKP64131.1 MAG: ATP-dependent zinc metalloprotease FtsH [Candidatus Moranbacteria bacterium GW2011_GWF2_34_56]HBI17708.1 cell division protein FtsH [Candidatus Moranbacteria bacterium]